eukprot:TRINITY_DN13848_c0_g1_i1.p1 TRINITY_DN13848_c0_g1~~TRINITY_DN13848_c0_g1_i1.p1  ORF type:complete len:123 (+),score=14.29 TRINITY_DN13848_c0_g1_i1:196-564(+)
MTNATRNATKHAEIVAMERLIASENGKQKLSRSVLYVTLEPCIMCAFALIIAGVKTVVYGASNERFGGCGSALSIHKEFGNLDCTSGILENETIQILKQFYALGNPSAPVPKRKVVQNESIL